METPKFTQEIKDKWVEALESGKYKQGYVQLHNKTDNTFCCIGVLGDVCDFLTNKKSEPYNFLHNAVGEDVTSILWRENDTMNHFRTERPKGYKDDYSNVLEMVKALNVQQ